MSENITVRIADLLPGMYEEPTNITLTADEAARAAQLLADAEPVIRKGRRPLYRLIIERDGRAAEIFTVCAKPIVEEDTPREKLLDELEGKYSLGAGLTQRAPGRDYLKLLDMPGHGSIENMIPNGFHERFAGSTTADDHSELMGQLGQVSWEKTDKKSFSGEYRFIQYDDNGGLELTFFISPDDRVMNAAGYEMKGEPVQRWAKAVKACAKSVGIPGTGLRMPKDLRNGGGISGE